MSIFDNIMPPISENAENPAQQFETDRYANMEQYVNDLSNHVATLEGQIRTQNQPTPQPPIPPTAFDLDIPHPPTFTGLAAQLPHFKFRVRSYFAGCPGKYNTDEKQLLYVSTKLENQAGEWLQAQLDPATGRLPSSWDLDEFLAALDSFFGGGVTP